MAKYLVGIGIIVVLAGALWFASARPAMEPQVSIEMGNPSAPSTNLGQVDLGQTNSLQAGSYEEYAPEKLAQAAQGKVVLFFHAAWCPYCRAADADIRARAASIPEGLTILKVDYDTATALKQKYGVTTQHTFVQVAADGTALNKWLGSETLANIVSHLR